MCYECHNLVIGCDYNPDSLVRCSAGTKMCFVTMAGRTGVEQYERGCLSPHGRKWYQCMVLQEKNCFTCYGTGCNHMELFTPSKLHCIQCSGKECDNAIVGERCNLVDTIFGPSMCVSKYAENGMVVDFKGCYNSIYKKAADFQRHLHFTCTGQMCNFQKVDALQRCIHYNGYFHTYRRTVRLCYAGQAPQRFSMFMGCYRDVSFGKLWWWCWVHGQGSFSPIYTFLLLPTDFQLFKVGCNSFRFIQQMVLCTKQPRCQMCFGDMCNDTPLRFLNSCYSSPNKTKVVCDYIESMCYTHKSE